MNNKNLFLLIVCIFALLTEVAESLQSQDKCLKDPFKSTTLLKQNKKLITLSSDNVVIIRGPIDEKSSSNFIFELLKLKSKTVYVYLITPGGSVVHGHNIIQTIDAVVQSGVEIVCIGDVVNSMGFVILQACPTRYVRSASILMQHQMSLGLDGPIEQIKSRLEFISGIKEIIETIETDRLKISKEDFFKRIDNDWWLYGKQAVENNVADEVVNVLCDHEMVTETYTTKISSPFGSIKFKFSKCPLIWDPIDTKMKGNKKKLKEIANNMFISNFINEVVNV